MPVANRSTRLRRLSGTLTELFGLPWGRGSLEAYYDETSREWSFRWTDGPTVAQVKKEATQRQPEACEGLKYVRRLSDEVCVAGLIRMTTAAEPHEDERFRGRHFFRSDIEQYFARAKNPSPKAGREATMVANLLKLAEGHGRNYMDMPERVADYLATYGFTRALADVELTPLELLTHRYAEGDAERAWRFRLATMTPLQAFSAVQADPEAMHDAITAALTLLPELHAALDTAAADLQARVKN
jgi:hypothetical protein